MRSSALLPLLAAALLSPLVAAQTAPHHQANFDSERKQADELFLASKPLEALPLYEDLCRQDPTIAVFASRHAAGLLARSSTILNNPQAAQAAHDQAVAELHRAQSLGDNSPYVQSVLSLSAAIPPGVPLTIGYTYQGNAQATPVFNQAEAAFGRSDWPAALKLYLQADQLDPAWYQLLLDTGDVYFRLHDAPNAGLWFAKAIAVDPNRETAYRYWGDALFQSGDHAAARDKFVQAVLAEPYSRPPLLELGQWTDRSGYQLFRPSITRPAFTAPAGKLAIDPALAASTADGRSAWIVYQHYRVDHGARTLDQPGLPTSPSAYQHTIAEEHAALTAMLATLDARITSGTLTESALDPNLRDLRTLSRTGLLDPWIALNAADAGIRADYAQYRAQHPKQLADYINGYLIRPTPPPAPAARPRNPPVSD